MDFQEIEIQIETCFEDKILLVKLTPTMEKDVIEISFFNEHTDWVALFEDYLFQIKSSNREGIYNSYLLKALYKYLTEKNTLKEAIDSICLQDRDTLLKGLSRYGQYISYNRQLILKDVFQIYNFDFKIYEPKTLIPPNEDCHSLGFFEIADKGYNPISDWIHDSMVVMNDYNLLIEYYPIFCKTKQLEIVRRYFYDIRQKRIKFDIKYLSRMINNDRTYLESFRYFVFELGGISGQNKCLELLLDCIKTYIEKGEFQTVNGLIDFYCSNTTDFYIPISFGHKEILQRCEGGLVRNYFFEGFIILSDIYVIDDSRFSIDELNKSLEEILKEYADNTEKTIDILRREKIKTLDSWIFEQDYIDLFRIISNGTIRERRIDKVMINRAFIKNRVCEYMNRIGEVYDNEGWIVKEDDKIVKILKKYFLKTKIRVSLNNGVSSGDIHIDNKILKERICSILNENLGREKENGIWIFDNGELPDEVKLLMNRHQIYFENKDGKKYINITKKDSFCIPCMSSRKESVIQKDFLWCKGQPCFHSCLEKKENWKEYYLSDIMEIIGYPMLDEQEVGYIPKEVYRKFVDYLVKAKEITDHLKCRECGHLLFPISPGKFWGHYNYYRCRNKDCYQYGKKIYINHCFDCKKQVIDSRETQKCKNGCYICPKCLSCCSDKNFEKIKDRYIEHGLLLKPDSWINCLIGKGHKEIGIHYCPKCGGEIKDAHCSKCGENYTTNLN